MKTRMIIVAAPSGAGKSSFVERVVVHEPRLKDIITYTTRSMRANESEGHPYHFIQHADFQQKVDSGYFVEWAKVHSNFYGTSFESIESAWKEGRVAIMDIDVQGVQTFKSKFPDAKTIFILPPNLEELRRRVIKRDGGEPPDLEIRMKNAQIEIQKAHEFDFQIINDDFDEAFGNFRQIIEKLLT